jgi:hypothetical protein
MHEEIGTINLCRIGCSPLGSFEQFHFRLGHV